MTEYATVNGQRITSGILRIPFSGIWVADFSLAGSETLANSVAIKIGNLNLEGHVYRTGSFTGARTARLLGGTGGLRKTLTSQAYYSSNGLRLSTILNDIASVVGERINIGVDRIIGNTFVREAKTASVVIRQEIGDMWWIDNQGVIQTSQRSDSRLITGVFDVESSNSGQGKYNISTEDLLAFMPCRTFQSVTVPDIKQISETIVTVNNDGKLRLDVLTTGPANV